MDGWSLMGRCWWKSVSGGVLVGESWWVLLGGVSGWVLIGGCLMLLGWY